MLEFTPQRPDRSVHAPPGRPPRIWVVLVTGICLGLLSVPSVSAQAAATISGVVLDADTGDGVYGADVVVEETDVTAKTNLDGEYSIELPPGKYTIRVNRSGYGKPNPSRVTVQAGEILQLEHPLEMEFFEFDTYEVFSEPLKGVGADLLSTRQNAASITDAIGSEQFARAGSGNAAEIMTKVTGATVVDSKYVFIRGLGDRYSNTLLNSGVVPTADPNRKSAQLDLFPSSAIDQVIVHKTFTPDLPGNFSGGTVNIVTKSFPERFIFSISSSTAYNTRATFNDDFLSYPGGGLDFIGFDDGTRELPGEVGETPIPDINRGNDAERLATAQLVESLNRSFEPVMAPSTDAAPLNHSHSISVGNTVRLFDRRFGFLAGLSYNRSFSFYGDGEVGRYEYEGNSNTLERRMQLSDARSETSVAWGSLVNLTYDLHPNHEIGFNFVYNQNGDDAARSQTGFLLGTREPVFETRTLHYTERNLNTFQLRGQHKFPELIGLENEWLASLSNTSQEEPDLRFLSFERNDDPANPFTRIARSGYPLPTRYFRELEEDNLNLKLDNTLPFQQWSGEDSEFKFGYFYSGSERTFDERRFAYDSNSRPTFETLSQNGDPLLFLDPSTLGFTQRGRTFVFDKYITDLPFNNYTGESTVNAGYAMIDLPVWKKLRLIGGIRVETTDITVVNSGEFEGTSEINELDPLPAAGLVYALTPSMNLRLNYGRTLARPTFREIALVPVFDFVGGDVLIGNPDLQRTIIDNYDFRWEWFPRPGEVLAVSLFYKELTQPIEKVILNVNRNVQYQNREEGTVYGVEVEARKTLDFIDDLLKDFSVGMNFTWTDSEVSIGEFELGQIRSVDPDAEETRVLAGQSPYIANMDFSYENPRIGTRATILFNIFGERLSAVSRGFTPDVFEQPAPTLDFTFSQRIWKNLQLKFSAKNLLDPDIKETYEHEGEEFLYSSRKRGRTFSVGLSYSF